MKRQPPVTIGVSAYNRKDLLRLSLNSLLAQTYENCQIVVVDDGSSDGTGQMMQTEFPQIKYIYQENAGDAAAKNHAARAGDGEYIVFNDSDDLFLPDAVARLVDALPENGCGCSYGTYLTIDADGNQLPTKRKTASFPSGMITGDLLRHIVVNNCGTLIPRKLFLEKGGFDPSLRVSYDYDFFLRISPECEFFALQEPVFLRRRHGSNLSAGSYDKLTITASVVDNFVKAHPELQEKYADIIRLRQADFHNKLRREAAKEKKFAEMLVHAEKAYKLAPGIKNFCRLAAAKLKGKGNEE